MKRTLSALVGTLALSHVCAANAAKIGMVKLDADTNAIFVVGDIDQEDGAKFRAEAAKYDQAIVLLESEGGSLAASIEIGETIHLKGYSTAVINGSSCNSGCALIWLAGTPRALSRSARLGFHAAYREKAGTLSESGVANAMVGRYLTLLNLPEKAVIFATSSPPSQLNWLTASNYERTGIDAKIIDDFNFDETKASTARPSNLPPIATVDTSNNHETEDWRVLSNWTVAVDHTLDNGCFLYAAFQRNTVFRVGVDRSSRGKYYIIFGNPAWKSLRVGQEYELQFQFDRNSPWNVPSKAIDMNGGILLRAQFTDVNFWIEFSKASSLDISRDGKAVTSLSMSGTRSAFTELANCQKYQDAKTRAEDPFAN